MEFKKNQEVIANIEGYEYKARINSPQEKKDPSRATIYIHDEDWAISSDRYYSIYRDQLKPAPLPTSVTGLVYDNNDDKFKLRMNPSEGQRLIAILGYTKGEYKDLIETIKQCEGFTDEQMLIVFKERLVS